MKAENQPPAPELADETSILSSTGDLDPRTNRSSIRSILSAIDAHDDKRVVVGGSVRTGRKPANLSAVLELNDGSCQQNLQAVVKNQVYDLQRLTPTGSSVVLEGVLQKLDGAEHKQLIELRVERVIAVGDDGEADAGVYPPPKTRFRLEGLTDLVHLRPRTDKLPYIVLLDGGVITPPDELVEYPASIPDNALCEGSTNDWLLLGIYDQIPEGTRYYFDNYVLHNPFSLEYVPLTELDAVLDRQYNIRKFLMRSTIHDFIAIITTNLNTPLIVILPGKGVWLPEPRATPYIHIVDIAFLRDKLYAITKAENLIPFDLGLNEDGSPKVTIGRRVIRQALDYEGYEWWPASDADNNDDEVEQEEEEEVADAAVALDEEEAAVPLDVVVDDYENDGQVVVNDEDGQNDLNYSSCPHNYISDEEIIIWHLVESCGKLLMVKPRMHIPPDFFGLSIRQVEVFEADFDTGEWVPMNNGLGRGQALFIGRDFSKSVSAPRGDVAEDDIYFIESGEVFNIKTHVSNQKRFRKPFYWGHIGLWLFPPELLL